MPAGAANKLETHCTTSFLNSLCSYFLLSLSFLSGVAPAVGVAQSVSPVVHQLVDRVLYCDGDARYSVSILSPSLQFLRHLLLVDSGACVTCMSADFMEKVGLVLEDKSVDPNLFSACGATLRVIGTVSVVLSLGGNNVLKTQIGRAHV